MRSKTQVVIELGMTLTVTLEVLLLRLGRLVLVTPSWFWSIMFRGAELQAEHWNLELIWDQPNIKSGKTNQISYKIIHRKLTSVYTMLLPFPFILFCKIPAKLAWAGIAQRFIPTLTANLWLACYPNTDIDCPDLLLAAAWKYVPSQQSWLKVRGPFLTNFVKTEISLKGNIYICEFV